MTFFWVYNQKSKTPSDGTCLGEPLGGFCDVGYHLHFLVALHLSFFFILILFSTSSLTLPWTIARFLDPFWTSSPAHCRVIHNTFIFNHSVIFLPRVATVLSGHFLPTGIFYLTLLPDIFGTTCFMKASLGAGSYSLKFVGLHTDPQNTNLAHLFVWFTVIHYLIYILNFYLYMSILQKFLLVVKILIKNIDQWPHHSAVMKI